MLYTKRNEARLSKTSNAVAPTWYNMDGLLVVPFYGLSVAVWRQSAGGTCCPQTVSLIDAHTVDMQLGVYLSARQCNL